MTNKTTKETTMSNQRSTILINKIDVVYRDIQSNDMQYAVTKFILNAFNENQLKEILKFSKRIRRQDKKENN